MNYPKLTHPWTFGIITDGKNQEGLMACIKSITDQPIPSVMREIIVVGGQNIKIDGEYNLRVIPFKESDRFGHITKKKNIIVQQAQFPNICLLHDYYVLVPSWYDGFLHFGDDWDVCANYLLNKEGQRHSDWLLNPDYMQRWLKTDYVIFHDLLRRFPGVEPKYVCGLPYTLRGLEQLQFVSGGYIVAKKCVLEDFPFDETLSWGQDEDVQWSEAFKLKYRLSLNPYSIAGANRPNKWHLQSLPDEYIPLIAEFFGQKNKIRYEQV